jgi:hypothetical protein
VTQGAVWYVSCRGQQQGPVDAGYVIQLIHSGQVDGSASVSAPHRPGWNPISQEPTFAPHLRPTSHPPAPMPYGGPAPYAAAAPAPYGQPVPTLGLAPSYPGAAAAYPRVPGVTPVVSSGKGMRIAAWILLGITAFWGLMTVLMAVDSDAKPGTWVGGMVLVVMFGLPGGLLLWRGRKAAARAQLVGFLRSRDRIRVSDVARMIKGNELEAEQLLAQLNVELRLDLVFVPDESQYVHRSRLSSTHQIPQNCPACGAPTENQLVLQGERVTCKYCDAIVA